VRIAVINWIIHNSMHRLDECKKRQLQFAHKCAATAGFVHTSASFFVGMKPVAIPGSADLTNELPTVKQTVLRCFQLKIVNLPQ